MVVAVVAAVAVVSAAAPPTTPAPALASTFVGVYLEV